ncbi:hypothetical protein L596_011948 [Steinernema carpocapsae]|uniref:Uncharacterized protein n=1 Tax=Steinernema carpocapsae TaxID=34508 RepID=A0A4U5NVY3_STECR|nr:hypothetical protein L596_011948 [Steinernema carpocapsae]
MVAFRTSDNPAIMLDALNELGMRASPKLHQNPVRKSLNVTLIAFSALLIDELLRFCQNYPLLFRLEQSILALQSSLYHNGPPTPHARPLAAPSARRSSHGAACSICQRSEHTLLLAARCSYENMTIQYRNYEANEDLRESLESVLQVAREGSTDQSLGDS